MPTASEAARAEAVSWLGIAGRWNEPGLSAAGDGRAPTEVATVVFYDPAPDLDRRGHIWGHRFERHDLAAIARFAAALADTEADAWESDHPDIATRAYEARRLLVGDRLIHWAVPWLDAMDRRHPEHVAAARADRDLLLWMGDEMRVAPEALRAEGLVVPDQDSYGPVAVDVPLGELLLSLWSGLVLFGASTQDDPRLPDLYTEAVTRWGTLAVQHPGSAALWLDLAARAEETARALGTA